MSSWSDTPEPCARIARNEGCGVERCGLCEARTLSICDVGDPVCDYDPDTTTDALSPAALAIHTSYAPTASGAHAWGTPLYQLVMAAEPDPATATGLSAHGA